MKKLNIFMCVQNFNWELHNLVQPLIDLGHSVENFDFRSEGYDQYSKEWLGMGRKKEMNEELLRRVQKAHAHKPIDVFIGYLSDPVIDIEYLMELKSYQIPLINFSCNDVFHFERGLSRTAPIFDLNWTTNLKAIENYKGVHAKVKFMPYGINHNFYKVIEGRDLPKYAYDVSFIGQPYGYRLPMFVHLINKGLSYGIFGKTSYKRLIRTILETRVCVNFLGLAGSEFSDKSSKQLRLRDFEVTALGGLLLTERIPEMQQLFEDKAEVLMYDSIEEFIDLAIYYSRYKNRKERLKISKAGQRRTLSCYTWERHYTELFKELKLV